MDKKKDWDGRTKAPSLGIRIFLWLITKLGLFPAYALLAFVSIFYTFNTSLHKKFIASYRNKLGLKTNYFQVYKHNFIFGIKIIDRYAHILKRKSPFKFTCIGEEHMHNALKLNKGLILLTAHIGNQQIGSDNLLVKMNTAINLLMFDNEKESIKDLVKNVDNIVKLNIIDVKQDSVAIMLDINNALERNEIVCMMGDRIAGKEKSVEVDFLGKKAEFPLGPFEIAMITGAPIITTLTVKKGYNSYLQKVYNYLHFENVERNQRKEYLKSHMIKYVEILEEMVKEYPYQWFNFYDFWKEY